MPPSWLRAFRTTWRTLTGWPAQTPVGHSPTESNGRQPQPHAGARGMSTAADPGGGAALDRGTSVAPPPLLPPPAPTNFHQHSEQPVDADQCARLRALSATLPSPDREIILLWAVAGVSIPDIVAILGVTPAAVRRAQSQALSALPPAATANGPLPAIRQRVVLLPHVRHHPNNRRAGRATGMNHDESLRPPPAHHGGTTRVISANTQWHDAELALKVARRGRCEQASDPSRTVGGAGFVHRTRRLHRHGVHHQGPHYDRTDRLPTTPAAKAPTTSANCAAKT
jgi:hypothetical protein